MELLDIVDENGNPKGETVEREKAHAEGIMHRTSHVWLLRKRSGKVQILLQKRSETKETFPGCYDISSAGHIPAGMDFAESAIRELKEELGITASADELILCGDRIIIWDDNFNGKPFHDRQYSRVFALWRDMNEEEFSLQKEEVD
ncbi:MAG TPA: NUDIX domain-containing protein, partial [Thermoclostridium sp.]